MKTQDTITELVKGIRPNTLKRLVILVWVLRSQHKEGKYWKAWFENEMTSEDIQKQLGCSSRTALDYFNTLKQLSRVFW